MTSGAVISTALPSTQNSSSTSSGGKAWTA